MTADPFPELSDEQVLAHFARGDAGAARALTLRLTPRVFAHAVRVLGNGADAEEVAQEAMMRLWRIAPDWRTGEAKVTTWLYRVVANLCTDRLRRRPPPSAPEGALHAIADPAAAADDRLQDRARAEALQRALLTLPARQREAIVLRHFDDLSQSEIAEIMETGVAAVESLLARGRRALAARLADCKEELGYAS